jgi:ribosomal protein S2
MLHGNILELMNKYLKITVTFGTRNDYSSKKINNFVENRRTWNEIAFK